MNVTPQSTIKKVKQWGISSGRRLLAETPVWRFFHPRRIHIYSIGLHKTGTSSIARIFEQSHRAGHEYHLEYTINLAFKKLQKKAPQDEVKRDLQRRDSWCRLECESNALLIYFASELAALFPEAKFICTVRSPKEWLRSAIDQQLNVSVESRKESNARTLRPWLYDVLPYEKYPEEERALAENGAWNLETYLDCWTDHYQRALSLPKDRILFIRTRNISSSTDRIARFVGIDLKSLSSSDTHANRTKKKNDVLAQIDKRHIKEKIKTICEKTMSHLSDRLKGCK